MAENTFEVRVEVRVNWGRYRSYKQQAIAELRRARKRDRPALFHRWVRKLTSCVSISIPGLP